MQLHLTLNRIDAYVILCARRKFKRLRQQRKGPRERFDRLCHPLFAMPWQWPNVAM